MKTSKVIQLVLICLCLTIAQCGQRVSLTQHDATTAKSDGTEEQGITSRRHQEASHKKRPPGQKHVTSPQELHRTLAMVIDENRRHHSGSLSLKSGLDQRDRLNDMRNGSTYCDLPDKEDRTFLWRIETHPPSYFFGTIHVPYTRVWDSIAINAKQAFMNSDRVYFELDLTNPYTIAALTSCQLLPRGLNLSQVLPPDIYSRLKGHLNWVKTEMRKWVTEDQEGRGLYADYLFNAITDNWERKRPIWVMLMINSLTASDIAARGFPILDLYLAQQAEKSNKQKGAVERVEEQCVPLNGLTYGQVIFALNQTLQQQEDIRKGLVGQRYNTDDLIRNYRCGNLNSIGFNQDTAQVPILSTANQLNREDQIVADEIDSYFRDHLIYKRNRRMGARVIELLLNNQDTSFFFAFGAGHFVGDQTVIDVVRNAGFSVSEVPRKEAVQTLLNSHSSKGSSNGGLRMHNGGGQATVQGTFDDLSDEERTKAFLQLLEYHLKLEKESGGDGRLSHGSSYVARPQDAGQDQVQDLWQKLPSHQPNPVRESDDEKSVRKSIQVWYGLSSASTSASSRGLTILFTLLAFGTKRILLL